MIAVMPQHSPSSAAPERIVLHGMSWDLYEMLLRDIGDQPIRVTYDNGSMEIMSPLPKHERWKTIIGGFIEILSLELNIPMSRLGSTTFRRRELRKGLEPDECYYIQHEEQIRNKDTIDLKTDPPPDLAVEVDITHRAIGRESIYAALGVAEVWRYDGLSLTALRLDPDGRYRPTEFSLAFPFLRVAELEQFLKMIPSAGETSAMRAFRDWATASFQEPNPPA
jgi:Uma2 family endonuclease